MRNHLIKLVIKPASVVIVFSSLLLYEFSLSYIIIYYYI